MHHNDCVPIEVFVFTRRCALCISAVYFLFCPSPGICAFWKLFWLAYGLAWLPRVLLLPFSGYWARYGSKPILVFANWIQSEKIGFHVSLFLCFSSVITAIWLFWFVFRSNLPESPQNFLGKGQTILAAETTVAKCLSGDPQGGRTGQAISPGAAFDVLRPDNRRSNVDILK